MRRHARNEKHPWAVTLGYALRLARKEARLRQAEVASHIGIVTEVYGRMERGQVLPSVPTLRKLCVLLAVDANALLGVGTRAAETWLRRSVLSEHPPRLRGVLRALRRCDDTQLAAVAAMLRAFVPRTLDSGPLT